MKISEMLLPEFDVEMANTRTTLQRVPANKADFAPHEKSMVLGRLAGHIAQLPSWAERIISTEFLDMQAVMKGYKPLISSSADELVATFDQYVKTAREALAGADDELLTRVWSIKFGDKILSSGTKLQMIRLMCLNHLVHHRAQLGVYLRLNNVPLPALYGPSADEGRSSFEGQ